MAVKGWKQIGDGVYETEIEGRKFTAHRILAGGTPAWMVKENGKEVNPAGSLSHARMVAKMHIKAHPKPEQSGTGERRYGHLRVIK